MKFISKFKNLTPVLTNIINNSISQGAFPDSLKIAKIIPLFKKGDKSLIANYRPISILNSLSKIFESIILKQLQTFLEKY